MTPSVEDAGGGGVSADEGVAPNFDMAQSEVDEGVLADMGATLPSDVAVASDSETDVADAVTEASDPMPLTVTLLSLSRVAPAAAAP